MCQANGSAVPTQQADDERVRITRWDFAPGAATGFHVHQYPYTVTYLTDAVMKIIAQDGSESLIEMQAGGSYSRPKGVAHDVINAGKVPMAFVEVEIKPTATV